MHPKRVEYYDPATETFTLGGIWEGRWAAAVTQLPNGLVLIAGGLSGETLDRVDLYHPGRDEIISTTTMSSPRARFQATLLPSGAVLVTGGEVKVTDGVYNLLRSAELFIP